MAFVRDDLDGLSYEQVCELADELAGAGGEVDASERREFDAYCREVGALRARLRPAPVAAETEVPKRGDHWPKEVGRRRAAKALALKQAALEQADERRRVEQAREDAYRRADREASDALHGLDMRVAQIEAEHDALILEAQQNM